MTVNVILESLCLKQTRQRALYNYGGGSCTCYGVVILVYSILKRQDFLTRTAHMAFNTETLTCEDECEHM